MKADLTLAAVSGVAAVAALAVAFAVGRDRLLLRTGFTFGVFYAVAGSVTGRLAGEIAGGLITAVCVWAWTQLRRPAALADVCSDTGAQLARDGHMVGWHLDDDGKPYGRCCGCSGVVELRLERRAYVPAARPPIADAAGRVLPCPSGAAAAWQVA